MVSVVGQMSPNTSLTKSGRRRRRRKCLNDLYNDVTFADATGENGGKNIAPFDTRKCHGGDAGFRV